MVSEDVLNMTVGFLAALFIMKSVRMLRPASAHDMSGMQSTGCTSCNKSRLL
jgi:hypothetical protein